MSVIKTGNTTHDSKVLTAEAVRQAAVTNTTSSKAAIISAEATFARTAATSAAANGCGIGPFMSWLRENGQSLYP